MATHKHIRVAGPMILENPFYELPALAIAQPPTGEGVEHKLHEIDSLSVAH